MSSTSIEQEILAELGIDPVTVEKGSVTITPIASGVLVTWKGHTFVERNRIASILAKEVVSE